MTYLDLLRASDNDATAAHGNARTALLPYMHAHPGAVRTHLRTILTFPAWLFRVPRRVLKRWATRAVKAGVPREGRLTGPSLTMHRRGTMTPGVRGFLP